MTTEQTTELTIERPVTLSVGIILSVITSCLALFCFLSVGGALGVVGAIAILEGAMPSLLGGALAGVGLLLLTTFFAFQLFTLYASWRAWEMNKAWIWVLLVLSALSIMNSGMLTAATGVVTIIGCVQALERLKTA